VTPPGELLVEHAADICWHSGRAHGGALDTFCDVTGRTAGEVAERRSADARQNGRSIELAAA
jgi:hypothetical protein